MKLISNIKKQFKRFMTGKSGFSLVELIVVIAIMAVMAAVLAPALLGYVERSRAQKDDSALSEVTNAIKLSLADQDVYDELLPYAVKGNFSCYADGDTSTNTDANKTITKAPDYWLFTDEARKLDETAYQPAGSMRGATVTFKPNGSAEYILKAGIVNQIGDESTKKGTNGGAILEDCPELYNRLRSTVGDTIKVSSQTYRNSTYTIFISMGTTGGNQADKQDAIQVYGQYNGTNLPEVMTATGSATQDKGNAGSGGSEEQPGSGAPTLDLSTVNTDLSTNTWADVQKVSQAGMVSEAGWTIGATKSFTVNGQTKTATLIGIDHDTTGTTTWMVTSWGGIGCHVMNSDWTNAGGWKDSEMRTWLNTTVYESMTDTKAYIKEVSKDTNNTGYQGTTASATQDRVFLLSPKEAGVADSANWDWYLEEYKLVLEMEGSTYAWFNGSNTIIDALWLRSPDSDDEEYFFTYYYDHVYNSVYIDFDTAHHDYTVCPAFVIG